MVADRIFSAIEDISIRHCVGAPDQSGHCEPLTQAWPRTAVVVYQGFAAAEHCRTGR